MNRTLTVSVDAMGGDAGPEVVVAALARVLPRHPGAMYLLHGDEALLRPLLAKRAKLSGRAEIRHTSEWVRMEDKPGLALRRGRNTSMWRAIESVAKKEADVAVSAGNTGALMAMSMFQLGVVGGISRPAIAALWPTTRGQSVVLDVGANIATTAEQLMDSAVMGTAFARAVLGLEKPTVGLLNVGSEDGKGIDTVRNAAALLRNIQLPMDYIGFVEGDDIAQGTADVFVTDGFTGNIALKTAEGTAKLVVEFMRNALRRSLMGRMGGFIASGPLRALARKLDPRAANGGIFLGLNGVVVKSHGSADAMGFASAIDMAISIAQSGVLARIVADRASVTPTSGAAAPELAAS